MTPTPWDALLLRTSTPVAFDRDTGGGDAVGTSKTAQIRAMLRTGPKNAAAICMEVDIRSTGLVWALLKHDIAMGRVRFIDGRYELASEFEQDLQQRVRAATRLLVAQGYLVVKP